MSILFLLIRVSQTVEDLQGQAETFAKQLSDAKIQTKPDKEIIALIDYLQRFGTDIKAVMTTQK